jgi:predicted ferric reductase
MPKAESHVSLTAGSRLPKLHPAILAVLYVLFCLAPLGLAAARQVVPADPWEYAAAGIGLIGLGAMAIQFITSGRFVIVSGHLGIDKVMAFHKFAVWWILLALILHPLAYIAPTWLDNPGLGAERLMAYLTLPRYRSGVVALAALVLLVASSVLRDRLPWRYEVWRASHVILALTAFGGGLHHAVTVGRFSAMGAAQDFWWLMGGMVIAVMLVLYGWRWWLLHQRPWRLKSVRKRADRLWELDIVPAPGTPRLDYIAGQFVWVTVGSIRFPLFDHPFSIASSSAQAGLRLIIKEAGDFTRQISRLAPGTPIGIDGPYGDFTLEAHKGDSVLLLAGGVGIAPVMGLLRDLVARVDPRPIRLAYAVGQPKNFACLPEIEAAKTKLDLHVMLVSEEAGPGWEGQIGRLDQSRLRYMLEGLDPARSVALICGPGPMVTAVSDTLLDLGMPMEKVIYERFDYAGGGASRQDRRRRRRFICIGAALAFGLALFVAFLS